MKRPPHQLPAPWTDTEPAAAADRWPQVDPPAFDAESDALLEAASYGFNNPAANERLAAVRARTIVPSMHVTCDFCERPTVVHPATGLYASFALCRTHATAARKAGNL